MFFKNFNAQFYLDIFGEKVFKSKVGKNKMLGYVYICSSLHEKTMLSPVSQEYGFAILQRVYIYFSFFCEAYIRWWYLL